VFGKVDTFWTYQKPKVEDHLGEMSHPADSEAWEEFDTRCQTLLQMPGTLDLALLLMGSIPITTWAKDTSCGMSLLFHTTLHLGVVLSSQIS
jgi:hypothetical protein